MTTSQFFLCAPEMRYLHPQTKIEQKRLTSIKGWIIGIL